MTYEWTVSAVAHDKHLRVSYTGDACACRLSHAIREMCEANDGVEEESGQFTFLFRFKTAEKAHKLAKIMDGSQGFRQ